MYGVLAILAALENVVPPVPADTAVALGAFLSHRGVTSLPAVYAVTLIANVGGAAGVYYAARRYGRRLFAGSAGRRLLTPQALATVEREYLRYGVIGIFFGRFLPGIRAVVAPFAGLANLSVARALIPMTLASAIWYALISVVGSAIGANWESIASALGTLNRTLGIVALIVVVAAAGWYVLRRRRSGREVLWGLLRRATGEHRDQRQGEEALRDAALLMLKLAYADEALTEAERREVEAHLRERWSLDPAERPGMTADDALEADSAGAAPLSRYRDRFTTQFAHERRTALLERLWQLAFESGGGQQARDRLTRRAADALGFSVAEVERIEALARGRPPAK